MKRLSTFITLMLAAFMLQAQQANQINFDQLAKKIEKSNSEIADAKKSVKVNTWITRGGLYAEVYESQLLNAYPGMDMQTFGLIIGKPLQQTQEDVDGVAVDKYTMERINFFFVNGKLDHWEVTKPLVENPLDIAFESYNKAIELDNGGKKTKKIVEGLNKLKGDFVNEGSNAYSLKNYKKAFENFAKAIKIGKNPLLNHKDTAIYYYTALSAQLAGLYEDALPYYKQALDLNFTSGGSIYFNIFDAYKSLGKAEEGVTYLEDGFLKYPQNSNILFSLISYYLDKGEDPNKIIGLIDKAIEQEPSNSSLYFAKGTLFDRLGNVDEAVSAYSKAIELKSDYFDAYYNIGALYFNIGVKYVEEANKVPANDTEKYDELMDKANKEFKMALPYMEKARNVNPESKEVLDALKNIYFRFRNESDDFMNKYNEVNEKIKSL